MTVPRCRRNPFVWRVVASKILKTTENYKFILKIKKLGSK
jgi:hypothetical protein